MSKTVKKTRDKKTKVEDSVTKSKVYDKISKNPDTDNLPWHLQSPQDVRTVREILLDEQDGRDCLTLLPLSPSDAVLDHCHASNYVRGVLDLHTNVFLGRVENAYVRDMKWWCPNPLPQLLRQMAHYLESGVNEKYLHPAWKKYLVIQFRKLQEPLKDKVLQSLVLKMQVQSQLTNNQKARLKEFERLLKLKALTFDEIKGVIEEVSKPV